MLSKCANSACSAQFLYLHRGRLFRMEIENVQTGDCCPAFGENAEIKTPARRFEYFWLCEDCAPRLTLKCKQGTVTTEPLRRARAAAS